jgi:glutamate-1-semialdehyde 2,1-aminomutase
VLIFDETITGFRWDLRGAQSYFGITPDLATFGKALANGFAVSALTGRRELMELGGTGHDSERVFLLSTTHGGETHSLAAARATLTELRERDVAAHLWAVGRDLCAGLDEAARTADVDHAFSAGGVPCSPVLTFSGSGGVSDAELRTLFLQEMVKRNVLIPYVAPSLSHGPSDVERTVAAASEAFAVLRRVLEGDPITRHLIGPVVRPVFRRYNTDPAGA